MPNRIIFGTVNGLSGYTPAVSVDAANDYWLLQQSGTYKSVNRNTLLGITGSPVGTTDTQTVQNKTLNNTNAITVKDGSFTLQNTADTTKQAVFSLSGITTGTTRTYTLPNASSTLADTSTVQTLTNKTLTSPTITGGTYDNGAITVDSISGHTTSTIVSVAGVQLNNGTIATSNAVGTTAISDGAVTPAKLQSGTGSGWSWQTNVPSYSGVTVGNGTNSGRYIQVGKTVFYRGEFLLGTTSAITGTILLTLPITARNDAGYEVTIAPIGNAILFDQAVNQYPAVSHLLSTTTASFQPVNASATYGTSSVAANATIPFTFGAGDGFIWHLTYEVA